MSSPLRMVRVKNYETVSKFVKLMPRILLTLFFGHGILITSICTVSSQTILAIKSYIKALNITLNKTHNVVGYLTSLSNAL